MPARWFLPGAVRLAMASLGLAGGVMMGCTQDVPLPEVSALDARADTARVHDTRRPEPDAPVAGDADPPADAPKPDRPLQCQAISFQPLHPKVIVAFDRSASMNDKPVAPATATRTQFAQQALRTIVQRYGRSVYFGYVEYPLACRGPGCCTSGVIPPGPHTLDAIDGWWRCRNMPPSCYDTTADSPLGSALARARNWYDNDDYVTASRFVFVLTDGEPGCSSGTIDECDLAQREVSRMAGWPDKVDTTVFGLTEAQRTSSCLNDVAASGGSLGTRVAVDGPQLEKALEEVLQPLSREACTLRLREPPGQDQELRVYLNRELVRRDQTHVNGWDFEDGAPSNVIVYGDWCRKLSTSQVDRYAMEMCFL
jgi:hypothetical protein